MDVVHIRVANALNGQELLKETAFSGPELLGQVLAALGSRPSRPVTLLRDSSLVRELRALPGDCLDLTAVVKDALSGDKREEYAQLLQSAGFDDAQRVFGALPEAARDDAAVVLTAVRLNARCLLQASELCRDDEAIVRAAVHAGLLQGIDLLQLAGRRRDNKAIMLAAVQQHPCNLQYAAEACREDADIVLAAVRIDGRSLQHAARSCRDNKAIVLAAVQQNCRAFAWAGPSCEKDVDVRRAGGW